MIGLSGAGKFRLGMSRFAFHALCVLLLKWVLGLWSLAENGRLQAEGGLEIPKRESRACRAARPEPELCPQTLKSEA